MLQLFLLPRIVDLVAFELELFALLQEMILFLKISGQLQFGVIVLLLQQLQLSIEGLHLLLVCLMLVLHVVDVLL